MSDKEIYNDMTDFHTRISNILIKSANKINVLDELKRFTIDFYDFKEKFKADKKIEVQSTSNNKKKP